MPTAPPILRWPISTERLTLSALQASDRDFYCALYTDVECMRLIGPPLSSQQAARSFRAALNQQAYADGQTSVQWRSVARLHGSELPLALFAVDLSAGEPVSAQIGVIVSASARRLGYAREGLRALLTALTAEGVDRVWLCAQHENRPMLQLAAELEFQPASPSTADASWAHWLRQVGHLN